MAKKISSRDLFEQEDIFKGIRDSADNTIKKLDTFKTQLKGLAQDTKKAFSGLKMSSTKEIEKLIQLTEKANKINKQSIQINKQQKTAAEQKKKSEVELLRIEQEKEKLKQQQMRTNKMVTAQQEKQNKQAEKQKKLAKDQANAYKRLEKNTRELKNQSKQLGAQMLELERVGKRNTQEYRKLASQYKKVTTAAQQGDRQLKKLDKTVGDNFRNVGNYTKALSGLTGMLGGLGVGLGFGALTRSTFGIIKDFGQAQADLRAITQKSKEELAGLTKQAKELGATTQFSATQITQMQVELAKLGFSTTQISQSTEGVANFAAATGVELPRAAALAGSALRGFNLEADEMDRVVSTLGVATTKTALDFSKLEAGLSTVAPVAASFGFSIEDTTALLGQLANAGFDASSAATATRNILLNLADANGDLAKELGRPIKNADDLAAGLQELEARGIDLAEALELTDKRSVAAFSTFIKQSDSLVELRDSITDVNDELEKMADDRMDSLQGDLIKLQSAWEGQILGMDGNTEASKTLRAAIQFLTENLATIISTIIKAVRFWAVYKTTTIAVNQVNKLMAINFGAIRKSLLALIPGTKAYSVQMRALRIQTQGTTRATKAAAVATKNLNMIMKRTPWGLVIAGATELYFWLTDSDEATEDLTDSTNELTEAQREQAEAQDREAQMVAEATGEFVGLIEQLKNTNEGSKERIKLINTINNQYGTTLQNLSDEIAFQEQLNQAVADYITFQKLKIKTQLNEEKVTNIIKDQIKTVDGVTKAFEKYNKVTGKNIKLSKEQLQNFENTGQLPAKLASDIDLLARSYQLYSKQASALGDVKIVDGKFQFSNQPNQASRFEQERAAEAQRKLNEIRAEFDALRPVIEARDKLLGLSNELNENSLTAIELQKELGKFNYKTPTKGATNYNKSTKGATTSQKEFNTEFRKLNDYVDQQNKLLFENEKLKQQATIEALERQRKTELDKQIENIRERGAFDASELNRLTKLKADAQVKLIKDERDFKIDEAKRQYEREKEARQQRLDDEKARLLAQKDITEEAEEEIEANFKIRQKELDKQERERLLDVETQKTNIALDAQNKIADVNRAKAKDIKNNEEKLTADLKKEQEKRVKDADDAAKKELERTKEIEEAKRELVKLGSDYFIAQSEKRISQIDKELAAAEKQADTLRELAAQGNINAEESLAEQERIIAESNRRKLEEQKLQQRIRLAESVYSTYSSKVEAGSKNPLAETIRDTTALQAFINSLPAFEKGTEDTGKQGEGVDGKGGFHAILHPNERVIPKSLNDQIGNLSNEELTKIAQEYNAGKMVKGGETKSSLEFALLVNEVKDLKRVIQDKPETNIELGQITQSAMDIVQSSKKGNTTTYNRYRVRK